MSRLATSFVLGYHGCDETIGLKAIRGDAALIQSDKEYDWLGPGVYFWESDPKRALEWARAKFAKSKTARPFVVGAVIDLRNCLDLTNRDDLEIVRMAYDAFLATQKVAGLPLPENRNVKGDPNSDRLLRFLDRAVINHLHSMIDDPVDGDPGLEPYDTVRGQSGVSKSDRHTVRPGQCGSRRPWQRGYDHPALAITSTSRFMPLSTLNSRV